MLIPKADRKKIHEASCSSPIPTHPPSAPSDSSAHPQTNNTQYLFREGVLVAKKDFNLPKHGDIDTKNLFVSLHLPRSKQPTLTSPGRESLSIPHLPRLPEDPVQLAILLLYPDPRRSRLPARMAPSPCRDRPSHTHQAAGRTRSPSRHDGR
jgi:hypothetical protein